MLIALVGVCLGASTPDSRCRIRESDADQVLESARAGEVGSADPTLFACVAAALDARERSDDAEWLLQAAVTFAQGRGDIWRAEARAELGRFYARNGRINEAERAWRQIAAIADSPARIRGQFVMAPDLILLSEERYRARYPSSSLRLLELIKDYETETGDASLVREPWVPYLLVRLGKKEAEQHFERRMREAREMATRDNVPLLLAQELEAYSDFLMFIGSTAKAKEVRVQANELRRGDIGGP
jgi:hypothetical protein